MKKGIYTTLLLGSLLYAGGDIAPVEPQIDLPTVSNGTSQPFDYNVALKVGTLGIGLDVSHMITENFGLRANINGFSYSDTQDVSDINYDADLKLFTAGLLADYYPFENNFRVSAGVYYNDNHADGVFKPSDGTTFELGDHEYDATEIGKVDAGAYYDDSIAPYIGFGWGNKSTSSGWGFTLDIGAMYQGSTKVYADATINDSVPDDQKAEIKQDIETERNQIEEDVKDYKWYPVIMIGVNYSF